MTSLSSMWPVREGDLYNVEGDEVTINGLTLRNNMLIMATKTIDVGEEPEFV
jgi:hypothetical protein